MAFGGVSSYLQQVGRAIHGQDGEVFAQLVSFRHPHAQNMQLQGDVDSACQSLLEPPYDEMIAAHLRCIAAQAEGDNINAYGCQAVSVQAFLKAFQAQKEENWCLPVLKVITLDLRMMALAVECRLSSSLVSHSLKPGEMLEKAADQIMACFRVCVSDNRTHIDFSKKWGTLSLVNQLFKIYFKINKLNLCKPLIRAIDSSDIKDQFYLADLVTYKYFVGKKAMFDSEFKKAAEYLEFAFDKCYISSRHNKRLILIYLVPVKMLLGQLPKRELLQKYNLLQFSDISQAVSEGNLLLLSQALSVHETFFIRYRIYLILEKLKMIVFRNLFKKVYLIQGTHQLNLKAFEGCVKYLGETDMDTDEVQCIIANLIDKAYIRGYISHQYQKLVVSKQIPFPPLSEVLK